MTFSNMGRFYQEADYEARDHKVRNMTKLLKPLRCPGVLNEGGALGSWLADLPVSNHRKRV